MRSPDSARTSALAALVLAAATITFAGCLAVAQKNTETPSGSSAPGAARGQTGGAGGAEAPLPTVADKTARFERRSGLLTLYLDRAKGKVWLDVPPPGVRGVCGRYLYVDALVAGLGSNPVGLDRGQLGNS